MKKPDYNFWLKNLSETTDKNEFCVRFKIFWKTVYDNNKSVFRDVEESLSQFQRKFFECRKEIIQDGIKAMLEFEEITLKAKSEKVPEFGKQEDSEQFTSQLCNLEDVLYYLKDRFWNGVFNSSNLGQLIQYAFLNAFEALSNAISKNNIEVYFSEIEKEYKRLNDVSKDKLKEIAELKKREHPNSINLFSDTSSSIFRIFQNFQFFALFLENSTYPYDVSRYILAKSNTLLMFLDSFKHFKSIKQSEQSIVCFEYGNLFKISNNPRAVFYQGKNKSARSGWVKLGGKTQSYAILCLAIEKLKIARVKNPNQKRVELSFVEIKECLDNPVKCDRPLSMIAPELMQRKVIRQLMDNILKKVRFSDTEMFLIERNKTYFLGFESS